MTPASVLLQLPVHHNFTILIMQTFLFLTILALAALPIYAEEEAVAEKKIDKRGLLGLGYGYNGYYNGLNGYGGYGHGYLNAPVYTALGHHGVAPSYSHGYTAPISINHGYTAPVYTVPRVSYQHGLTGHGLNYLHGW